MTAFFHAFSLVFLLLAVPSFVLADQPNGRRLKILINSPSLGFSHIQFHGTLADLLVDAGHEVHFHIPLFEAKEMRNGTHKAHRVVRYAAPAQPEQAAAEPRTVDDHELNANPFKTKETGNLDNSEEYLSAIFNFCKMQLEDREYFEAIVREKFDVAIAEQFDVCAHFFFHAAGIPTTLTTSTMISAFEMAARAYELDTWHSYMPAGMCFSSIELPYMSFAERVRNLYRSWTVCQAMERFVSRFQSLFAAHFSRPMPDFYAVLGRTSYAFVNSAESLEHPRPVTRKIRPIGGITLNLTATSLSSELEAIYARAKKGVVLLSFGSNIESNLMPSAMKAGVLRAFGRFPDFEFVWRIDPDEETRRAIADVPNVYPMKWVDQRAILADERTKLFISHCGANGVLEAAFSGQPVLAVPFFNDQFSNAALLTTRKTAVLLRTDDINEANLVEALKRLLEDPCYLRNARELGARLRAHPDDPRRSFVRFVEHAAAFQHSDLELPAQHLSLVVLYNIDVWAAGVLLFSLVFTAVWLVVRKVRSVLWSERAGKRTKSE